MCGAVSIKYNPKFKQELGKYFAAKEIDRFEKNGEIVYSNTNLPASVREMSPFIKKYWEK